MELIHKHRPRGDLPIANAALRAKGIVVGAAKSIKTSKNANKHQLTEGQAVIYKPLQRKSGKRPKVVKYKGNQSYLIGNDEGAVYRHTKFHLNHAHQSKNQLKNQHQRILKWNNVDNYDQYGHQNKWTNKTINGQGINEHRKTPMD